MPDDDELVISHLFEIADRDNSGDLSMLEFLDAANFSSGGNLVTEKRMRPWIKRFMAFNHNSDGVLSAQEAHARVSIADRLSNLG